LTKANRPRHPKKQLIRRTTIICSLLIATFFLSEYLGHFKAVEPLRPLSTFPTRIGKWRGHVERFDQKIYDVLGVDDSFLCDYWSPDGKNINLYIGYYASQREGDIIHSPKNCMPGAGWNIIRTELVNLDVLQSEPHKIKVIKLTLQKGSQRQVMLYWFQSRGRIISSEYWQKIYLVLDSILKRRTDGSFVRLAAPVTRSEPETMHELEGFAQELFPILEQYLPGA